MTSLVAVLHQAPPPPPPVPTESRAVPSASSLTLHDYFNLSQAAEARRIKEQAIHKRLR